LANGLLARAARDDHAARAAPPVGGRNASQPLLVIFAKDYHQLLLLSLRGLDLLALENPEIRRAIRPSGGLPLIPRTRGLSRIPMVGPWGTDGGPGALLPTLSGAVVVDLEGDNQRFLNFPMIADYTTQAPGLPDPTDPFVSATFTWPLLLPGQDTADGTTDLFAL
jgi:hypothetical protein